MLRPFVWAMSPEDSPREIGERGSATAQTTVSEPPPPPNQAEKKRAYFRAYRQRPYVRARDRAYRQRPEVKLHNRERSRARNRTPERKAWMKAYLQRPEVHARSVEYHRIRARANRRSLRNRVLLALGNKCARCPQTDPRCLQVDHKDGGGNRERRLLGGTERVYRKVLRHPDLYQLLCGNCHLVKTHENGEYDRPVPSDYAGHLIERCQ